MTEPQYPPDRRSRYTDDEGGTTQDLASKAPRGIAARPVPPPAGGEWFDRPGAEHHIRSRGRWMIICGTAVTVLSAALAVFWDAGWSEDMPLGLLLPLQAFGLGGITMGVLEHLARPHRSAQQRCLDRIDQVELALMDLVGLMDEELQQRFYNGAAWQVRNAWVAAGAENARPLNKFRTDGVVPFRRQRNGS